MEKSIEAFCKEIEVLFENESYKEIIDLLPDSVLDKFSNDELFIWSARAHGKLNSDLNLIMSYAQKAININENNYRAYGIRGYIWQKKREFEKAISDYTKSIELNSQYVFAYNNRGLIWLEKGEYEKAISDYTKSIQIEPTESSAYNNRGNAYANKGEYDKAILDYTQAISLDSKNVLAYNNRGNAYAAMGEYEKAKLEYSIALELKSDEVATYNNLGILAKNQNNIDEAILYYTKAIELNPTYVDAYYNRGLLGKTHGVRLQESIKDFEKYLELTNERDDIWTKRAKELIIELREKNIDENLKEISTVTSEIKKLLLTKDGCITHYTGLTVSKILILDINSRFRISEGSFLNDTSEGTELFNFLGNKFHVTSDGLVAETFASKPFIGSFVSEKKYDDLNLWRFYGKENGIEAKGCAITVKIKEFIDSITFSISKGFQKADSTSEDDINFYRVAYWNHDLDKPIFYIPNSTEDEEKKLSDLMVTLKEKVSNYKEVDKSVLEKYLNNIAFLFKSEAYKNETEIRLVIRGIEFEKKFDFNSNPPRVYIELVNIRNLVEQITIGPKVERAEEWAAAFFYSYNSSIDDNNPPKITISRLPYK